MANPYNFEFLGQLIGREETQRLEFKSSRELLNENSQKRNAFISDQIARAVSAFLNTDGGLLIIGMEEKGGVATGLSDGVPRTRITWEQLQSSICDRIQPAVAGYISVFAVPVAESSAGERLFAFVVDVKPGITAYQAPDKKYYVRRSGQSEAMEDKDIRLRMLATDKPRLVVGLKPLIERHPQISRYISYVTWVLSLENAGLVNVPKAIVRSQLSLHGLSELGQKIISSSTPEYQVTHFRIADLDDFGLLPGQQFDYPLVKVSDSAIRECPEPADVGMRLDITVFVDNGLPSELRNYDLMADLRPIIDAQWHISSS